MPVLGEKIALVLSGGGAKGAYAVGAITYLFDRGLRAFDVYAGTSTGALIAPLALAGELPALRTAYTNSRMPDFLQPQSLSDVLKGRSLFDTTSFRKTLERLVTPAVVTRVFAADAPQLIQTAVHLRTGKLFLFHTGPVPGVPPLPGVFWKSYFDEPADLSLRERLLRVMQASGSEPVFMAPVRVFGAEDFVDGGVRSVAPIRFAMECGATRVFAVILRPLVPADANPSSFAATPGILMRTIDIYGEDTGAKDLALAGEWLQRFPQVKLHIVRPATSLPGVSLGPDPVAMSAMMRQGEADAKAQLEADAGARDFLDRVAVAPPIV